jgi:uroporphyrinogen decarboxylase
VDRTPAWFMRQAGRYLPQYRAIRQRHTLLEICRQPELAAEVTLHPVRAFEVDAAILFADILLPLEPMGAPFEFAAGEGPVVHHPVRDAQGVHALRLIDPEESLDHVLAAIRLVRRELERRTPLIGFAGGPFTLASYLVEGGKSQAFRLTKRFMYQQPQLWHVLLGKLSEVVRRYLRAQVAAGAQAVQLFDSWVGVVSPADYLEFIQRHVRHILADLESTGVPVIHFGTGTGALLEVQRDAGGTVIGLDWRTPLQVARQRLGPGIALQGNLDPVLLSAPRELLAQRVDQVLSAAGSTGGHVFNLGHGLLPDTPPDAVKYVTDLVHERSAR